MKPEYRVRETGDWLFRYMVVMKTNLPGLRWLPMKSTLTVRGAHRWIAKRQAELERRR